jgi:hypothetical protein
MAHDPLAQDKRLAEHLEAVGRGPRK